MSNASTSPSTSPTTRRPRRRVRAGVAALCLAAVVTGGMAVHHVTQPEEPRQWAMMSAIPTPCDGFADCIYTAYWYAFLR
jgi:hypothetical protein